MQCVRPICVIVSPHLWTEVTELGRIQLPKFGIPSLLDAMLWSAKILPLTRAVVFLTMERQRHGTSFEAMFIVVLKQSDF